VTKVAVIGGGVVGVAVTRALALAGVEATLLERLERLAGGASGGNSGILHTGFDSPAGELESRLIQRGAELREGLLDTLGVPVWRCGARMTPRDEEQRAAVLELHENARAAGIETTLGARGDLHVPGESVTDPVLYTRALAACAVAAGAELRLGARVVGLEARGAEIEVAIEGDARPLRVEVVVNCAGLYADEIARMVGDDRFAIYPRKGEFLVFSQPGGRLEEILLPIPSKLGKGVLVFPTVDGHVIAGPTAREREDKEDRSVEGDARELILTRALSICPSLAGQEPIAAYAGLRPAGRGVNYVIEPSPNAERLLHVAAIRSTGLSACLGIAEHVLALLAGRGLVEPRPAPTSPRMQRVPDADGSPWWKLAR
jgi:glycerol-3-phosphate dehydrogenase